MPGGGHVFEISDPIQYRAGIQELRRRCPSPKAMMSFRDADLVEGALSGAFSAAAPRAPRILEWGCGLSTLYYTRALAELGEFLWVTVEYDRAFFEQRVAPFLTLWSDVQVLKVSSAAEVEAAVSDGLPSRGIVALVFDAGSLTPAQNEPDRHADLDAYVDAPARLGTPFDVVMVDGRKRRRCLISASRLVTEDGAVLLHDAHRAYYHGAFSEFAQSHRIGDDLWIGGHAAADLGRFVPTDVLAVE